MSTALHDVSHELRDADGRWSKGALSEKAQRAKLNYRKANKPEQDYAEAQEGVLATKLGGVQDKSTNGVFDIYITHGGSKNLFEKGLVHGMEVKTKVNGQLHEITMKGHAKERKLTWVKQPKRVLHTVVLDHRDRYNKGEFKAYHSGHVMYYKRGVGKMRLSNMHQVKTTAELVQLMRMPYADLPVKAKATNK